MLYAIFVLDLKVVKWDAPTEIVEQEEFDKFEDESEETEVEIPEVKK